MPDNYLDDKYIDKAWEQMQQMLDQEMPVERKRRKAAFWWWFLPMALGLAIAAAWWFSNLKEMPPKPEKTVQSPIAEADEAKSLPGNNLENQTSSAQMDQNPTLRPSEKLATTPEKLANKLKSADAASSEFKAENKAIVVQNEQAPAKKATEIVPQNTVRAATVEENAANPAQNTTSNTSTTFPSQQPIEPFLLNDLSQIAPELLPAQELALGWSPTTLRQSSHWRWGAEAALHAGSISGLDGYSFGLLVDMPLQGRKFYLRSGLNIGDQKLRLEPQKSNGNFSADFANDPTQSPTSSNTQAEAAAVIANFNIQASQLTVPITFVYQPRKKWGIEGGASLSYLLRATQLSSDEAIQESSFPGGSLGFNQDTSYVNRYVHSLASSAGQSVNLSELNRWELAAAAGLVYYPADRWGLRLQYRFGITDFLKNDDFQSYNRNVRLSAVYYLR